MTLKSIPRTRLVPIPYVVTHASAYFEVCDKLREYGIVVYGTKAGGPLDSYGYAEHIDEITFAYVELWYRMAGPAYEPWRYPPPHIAYDAPLLPNGALMNFQAYVEQVIKPALERGEV